ncbi:hypothetical protein [Neokomagataea anthophila]|uniref:IcmF-related N-terminal domain-containing protein n=1 Tax=Neokomagataea anthophila TaxID=2826925 RepID=A0ABS5E926_9PROT|nr:hypothetical protein [Neokomagataea anthophila]MBR0560413.1 hypothetical protein [Neokomagataea anthophila]
MKIWLQTRSETQDYKFLEQEPPEYWWGIKLYKDSTSFEAPTLILERLGDDQWRCFISAIPSARKDRVDTAIRYTLVLEGSISSDEDMLFKVLGHVLAVFAKYPASEVNPLTKLLDDTIGNGIDQWFGGAPVDDTGSVENLLIEALRGLDDVFAPNGVVDKGGSLPSKSKVLSALKDVLNSGHDVHKPSLAALFNFIGTDKDNETIQNIEYELRETDHKGILIIGSPVAGGDISDFFIVTPRQNPVKNVASEEKEQSRALWILGCVALIALIVALVIALMGTGAQGQ